MTWVSVVLGVLMAHHFAEARTFLAFQGAASCTGITTGGTQGSVRLSDAAVGSVQDESQPVYEVTTVLDSSTTSSKGGMFQYMALDPRNPDRLLVSDGESAIWEVADLKRPSLQLLTGGPSPSSLQTPAHGSHIPDMRGAGAAHVGAATLERPRGICVDEWGGLWVADVKASAVSLVDAKTGNLTVVAGLPFGPGNRDGLGSDARLSAPTSIVCLPGGGVLVGDVGNRNLRRVACVEHCPGGRPSPGHHAAPRWKTVLAATSAGLAGAALVAALAVWGRMACHQAVEHARSRHAGSGGRDLLGAGHLLPASLTTPLTTEQVGERAEAVSQHQHLEPEGSMEQTEGEQAGTAGHKDATLPGKSISSRKDPLISLPDTPAATRPTTPGPLIQLDEGPEDAAAAHVAAAVTSSVIEHVVHGAAGGSVQGPDSGGGGGFI